MSLLAPFFQLPRKLLAAYGMLSPWPRWKMIDPSGYGDYSSITEFCAAAAQAAAAVPAGLSSSARWRGWVLPGIYNESPDVPSYVTLWGGGGNLTTITGTTTIHGRTVIGGFNHSVANPSTVAIKVIHDVVGGVPWIQESNILVTNTTNAATTGIEVAGSNLSGFVYVRGCYFDIDNKSSGSSVRNSCIRALPGSPYIRSFGCQYKTTGAVNAQGRHMLVWNQGDHANCQIEAVGPWEHYYTATGYAMYNENPFAPGGLGDIRLGGNRSLTDKTPPDLLYYDPHADVESNFYRQMVHSIDVRNVLRLGGRSVDFGAAPPTSGTWALASIRYNSAPQAGGSIGWTCVVAGSPGTWKAFGAIAA